MENVLSKKVSLQETQKNLKAYFETHDVQYVAEDAVFTSMNTGEKTVGREAIAQMLQYIYHIAFDARAELKNMIVTEDKALLEADFIGKHVGEFAGLQPTNREVNVPLCITYDLEDGLVRNGRVYFLMDVLMKQLTT